MKHFWKTLLHRLPPDYPRTEWDWAIEALPIALLAIALLAIALALGVAPASLRV